MADVYPSEVSTLTRGRAVHFMVTASGALMSLLPPYERYFRDPATDPALPIKVEKQAYGDI